MEDKSYCLVCNGEGTVKSITRQQQEHALLKEKTKRLYKLRAANVGMTLAAFPTILGTSRLLADFTKWVSAVDPNGGMAGSITFIFILCGMIGGVVGALGGAVQTVDNWGKL